MWGEAKYIYIYEVIWYLEHLSYTNTFPCFYRAPSGPYYKNEGEEPFKMDRTDCKILPSRNISKVCQQKSFCQGKAVEKR